MGHWGTVGGAAGGLHRVHTSSYPAGVFTHLVSCWAMCVGWESPPVQMRVVAVGPQAAVMRKTEGRGGYPKASVCVPIVLLQVRSPRFRAHTHSESVVELAFAFCVCLT